VSSICDAAGCDRPTQDVICGGCTKELVHELKAIMQDGRDRKNQPRWGLYHELQITVSRQDVISRDVKTRKTRGESQPLPFKEHAAEVLADLRNTVYYWAGQFKEANPHLATRRFTVPEAAHWLASFPGLLAMHPRAGDLVNDILRVTTDARRAVDRPAEKKYLGRCEVETEYGKCDAELFGFEHKTTVRCPDCETEHDSLELWNAFQEKVRGYAATPAEIAGYISKVFRRDIPASTIHTWGQRGVVQVHNYNLSGEKLYRIGDVLDAAEKFGLVKRAA